jgi:alkylation response protein AidB-like acyl-CoA dehydrogenase
VLAGCVELARAQLIPAFILSQFQSACTRIVAAERQEPRRRWLPRLAAGRSFATVGISHLTTSRQHTERPAVLAEPLPTGFRISGEIPWVTGGAHADVLVAGATLPDRSQILFAVPTNRDGVTVARHWPLLALTGSETGPVVLDRVEISIDELLSGPADKVMRQGTAGGTGSLTTSALAIGHAIGCLDRLAREAESRADLEDVVRAFQSDTKDVHSLLLRAGRGESGPDETPEVLRAQATALALKTSQALLTATKGAGFIKGHPAERLAREAMFFLVWSCPQAVSSKLLRDFSQCESE